MPEKVFILDLNRLSDLLERREWERYVVLVLQLFVRIYVQWNLDI